MASCSIAVDHEGVGEITFSCSDSVPPYEAACTPLKHLEAEDIWRTKIEQDDFMRGTMFVMGNLGIRLVPAGFFSEAVSTPSYLSIGFLFCWMRTAHCSLNLVLNVFTAVDALILRQAPKPHWRGWLQTWGIYQDARGAFTVLSGACPSHRDSQLAMQGSCLVWLEL